MFKIIFSTWDCHVCIFRTYLGYMAAIGSVKSTSVVIWRSLLTLWQRRWSHYQKKWLLKYLMDFWNSKLSSMQAIYFCSWMVCQVPRDRRKVVPRQHFSLLPICHICSPDVVLEIERMLSHVHKSFTSPCNIQLRTVIWLALTGEVSESIGHISKFSLLTLFSSVLHVTIIFANDWTHLPAFCQPVICKAYG